MKKFLSLLIPITLVACNEASTEDSNSDDQTNTVTETHEVQGFDESEIENDEGDFEGVDSKHVLFCRIGIYQEPAIMVLDWGERDENNIYPITGYYYYLKHGKFLDLEGYSEPSTRGIYLTESYKGKETGYMEFAQDEWDGENYWAPSKESEDHQDFYSEDVLFFDPMDFNLALDIRHYTYDHTVEMYDGAEDYTLDVTNELHVTIIDEQYFAFDLHVTCTNGHVGQVDGITQFTGSTVHYDNGEKDEWDKCDLEFDLSKEGEITVTENNCKAYHGARAYFDGTLYLEE